MTLFSSENSGCTKALARCTSSLMTPIPALILEKSPQRCNGPRASASALLGLARARRKHYTPLVLGFLRIIAIINAAVWFGSIVFFTFAAGPAFFTDEMIRLLGKAHAGAAAQLVVHRYFIV